MSDWLDTADAIGRELCATAIWHEGRCNWVGALPEEGPGGSVVMTWAALTPELYGGSSGVGLFLAELYAHTGDAAARDTAAAALRHALASPRPEAPGLYAGHLGIAVAAARAARLLDDQTLEPAIHSGGDGGFDLMAGEAGGVVALLILAAMTGDAALRGRAIAAGERLLDDGRARRDELSWAAPMLPGRPHLTGLSHGASGAALALLELAAVTGEPAFADAAGRAFAYERRLYDPRAGNWPDLRNDPPGFAPFWCHGAPGIALARLRAAELGMSQAGDDASRALATTRRAVTAELSAGGNFSLCHGLAGNAEILLEGGDHATAEEVAGTGIERYAHNGRPWPCGTISGVTPALFLGLAGIGRFYLRLHDPQLPSLLLPRPAAF
jgi:class II lanthipeptide synthase